MKNKLILLLTVSVLFSTGCGLFGGSKGGTKTKKVKTKFSSARSMSTVLSAAKAANKPVLLDFYTTWCAPCKWMDEDVFGNPEVAQFLNKNFMSYKIDAEKKADIAKKYGVTGYPTLVFLNQKGKVIKKYTGMTSGSNVISMGKETLKQSH